MLIHLAEFSKVMTAYAVHSILPARIAFARLRAATAFAAMVYVTDISYISYHRSISVLVLYIISCSVSHYEFYILSCSYPPRLSRFSGRLMPD
jgi:hypothetical protein